MSVFRTRFAPSPTYYLHLGHALSALHVWRRAQEADGEVLLRIEDIDTTRCRPEYTAAIFADLAWLGLTWPEPVRVQSEHFHDYDAVVDALTQRGLTYRCFRTRTELAALADPKRPGRHETAEEKRRFGAGDPFARRLSLTACRDILGEKWTTLTWRERTAHGIEMRAVDPEREGDIVLSRKDSPSAYHVAATHDDALQGVTDIIRGEDLIDAPHVQTLLQELMGWPKPVCEHHALLLDEDGTKLSKRQRSISLASLRADGMTAEQVRTRLGFH